MARRELNVTPRQVIGKKVAQLRRSGVLPANIYGNGLESISIQVGLDELEKALKSATANEVIDVHVAGERAPRSVVLHKLQRNPVTSSLLHADFYQVSLRVKMRADVPLVLVGVSDAVETYKGVVVSSLETLHVEALPLDIPTHIEIDISVLTELEAAIHVRDLILSGDVTILNDPEVMIVKVASPRVMEGETVTAAAPAVEGEPVAEAAPEAEGSS